MAERMVTNTVLDSGLVLAPWLIIDPVSSEASRRNHTVYVTNIHT